MPRQPSSSPLWTYPSGHDGNSLRSSYGLLEPQLIAAPQPSGPRRLERSTSFSSPPSPNLYRQKSRRKSVSIGRDLVIPAWTEVEASLDVLKDCSIELGATLGSFGGKLSDTVPGVKGSVAFLSILRSNIQLSSGVATGSPSSPISVHTMTSTESQHVTGSRANTLTSVPELVYETPASPAARIDGLRLVADSVAQMRQMAAATMIRSPLSLAVVAAVPVLLYTVLQRKSPDHFSVFLTTIGVAMTLLIGVRMMLKGYIEQAEAIDWRWLNGDHMLVARFGSDIIGVLIYSAHVSSSATPEDVAFTACALPTKAMRRQSQSKRGQTKVQIRAWTVRRRERGHGVGKALLEAAVTRFMGEHGCTDVSFASPENGRAGSHPVVGKSLAQLTNLESVLIGNERRAEAMLESIMRRRAE